MRRFPYISLIETDSAPDSSSGSSVADEEKYKVGDSYEGDSLKVKFVECGEYTDNTAFSCNLSAGRSGSGTVMFEVPENSEEIDIEFSPSFWRSEHVVFKYSK